MKKFSSLYLLKKYLLFLLFGKPSIGIEIQLVNHCNLNCKGCSHFSNISDEFYINPQILENDLVELNKKFKIKWVAFIGGEPLLHPDLITCLQITKKVLNNVIINICTNGTLVFQLSNDVLNYISKNGIKFVFSKYPINNSYFTKILDFVDEKNIEANFIYNRNYFRKYINLKGNSNIINTYKNCCMRQCYILREGRIYHCPFSCYVHIFNNKFNQNIKVENGIDIYKSSAKSIINYLSRPIETCRFCTFNQSENVKMKWENGKADMNDWIIN